MWMRWWRRLGSRRRPSSRTSSILRCEPWLACRGDNLPSWGPPSMHTHCRLLPSSVRLRRLLPRAPERSCFSSSATLPSTLFHCRSICASVFQYLTAFHCQPSDRPDSCTNALTLHAPAPLHCGIAIRCPLSSGILLLLVVQVLMAGGSRCMCTSTSDLALCNMSLA